jgi:hypothetical protein
LVKCGHVGSGKYAEKAIYIRAKNATEAFQKAKHHSGVKKGCLFRNGASVLTVDKAV